MPTTWGYILDGPGRPPAKKQQETLDLLGVDCGTFGTCFQDKIKRGSTRPRHQLEKRNDLLGAVMSGDTVVFAAPLCIGGGVSDVAWFLGELREKGVTIAVGGEVDRIEPGGDVSGLRKKFASAQNTYHVRASKRKARKST